MKRLARLAAQAVFVLGVFTAYTPDVNAHGEAAQEGFIRTRTVAFYDVTFSTAAIRVGEEVTITGKFNLLKSWPANLAKPDLIFLTAAVPGPQMVVEDRKLNGMFTPGAVSPRTGEEYDFKLTLRGRRPGQYHIHPIVSVQHVGPLLGPGEWISIEPGAFTNPVTLLSGKTVDLETYGLPRIITWHAVVLALGLGWLLFWIVRPILRRTLWVASGAEAQLITRRDLLVSVLVGVLTIAMILVGYLSTTRSYPDIIPQQVVRLEIPRLPQPERVVEITPGVAKYHPATRTLTMELRATNRGSRPVSLQQFSTSMLSFMSLATSNQAPTPGAVYALRVDPGLPIHPGRTQLLKLTITSKMWEEHRLMDLREAQLRFGGLLFFQDSTGLRSVVPIDLPLQPSFGVGLT
jgi:methane/ammonia monooxygenase subunit B